MRGTVLQIVWTWCDVTLITDTAHKEGSLNVVLVGRLGETEL